MTKKTGDILKMHQKAIDGLWDDNVKKLYHDPNMIKEHNVRLQVLHFDNLTIIAMLEKLLDIQVNKLKKKDDDGGA